MFASAKPLQRHMTVAAGDEKPRVVAATAGDAPSLFTTDARSPPAAVNTRASRGSLRGLITERRTPVSRRRAATPRQSSPRKPSATVVTGRPVGGLRPTAMQ